jgi:hypothetical protein
VQYPGWAEIPDATKPGELVVHLVGVPVAGPYWIFKLGPETYGQNGLYEYAVVSSELQLSLFVLARNVSTFYSTWKYEIDIYLKQNGWDKVSYSGKMNPLACGIAFSLSCVDLYMYTVALEQPYQHHTNRMHVLVNSRGGSRSVRH